MTLVYEHSLFTTKNKLFKQENFVDEVKHFYTDLINLLVKDDKEKLHVFDSNGLYLATKKIGKNNPKAEQIQTDNEMQNHLYTLSTDKGIHTASRQKAAPRRVSPCSLRLI